MATEGDVLRDAVIRGMWASEVEDEGGVSLGMVAIWGTRNELGMLEGRWVAKEVTIFI